MHANIYRQQQELQKQAAKEFAAINNRRYTAKKSGAWYPRITTERMIFTTTWAHIDPTQAPVWLISHISPKYLKALIN